MSKYTYKHSQPGSLAFFPIAYRILFLVYLPVDKRDRTTWGMSPCTIFCATFYYVWYAATKGHKTN